jgi:hypothetical protein
MQHEFILHEEQIMPKTSKSSKKATPVVGAAPKTEFTDLFTPLYLNQVARAAELQKTSLDFAAKQTAEWIGAWKKAFGSCPVPTPTFFFDIFGQAVETCVETQKSAIDLVVEQTEALTQIAKERAGAYSKISDGVKATVQATVAQSVDAQKKVLEFASAQSKALCQATKKQIGGGPATVIVDAFERGADTLIEAQKTFLNATTQPFVAAAKA